MQDELIFIGTSDLSAHFRGKSFPASELPSKRVQGVGLAPTNLYMGALGPIQMTTFGTAGEVFLVPDESTRVHLPDEGQGGEHFYLGDFVEMEYIDATRPATAYVGTPPRRFYFRSFDIPFVLSEYLVVAPASLPLRVEAVAGAPPLTRRKTVATPISPVPKTS